MAMQSNIYTQHELTKEDILLDSRFFSRSYLEMQVLKCDEIDYLCFVDLRNSFCAEMLDRESSLQLFFVDVLVKLHFFAFHSIDHSIRFAVECVELMNIDILYPIKRDMITDASHYS